MGTFSKIKKYSKPSHEIEEKIDQLNKELIKTGMLSEVMTTSSLYPEKEIQPYIPPTFSNVPDTSGVTGGPFTQNDITNNNTGYTDNSQLFNTNIGNSPTPIIQTPSETPSGGAGLAWHSVTLNGNAVGYIGPGNKFKQVLNPSIAGGTDTSYDGAGYFGPNYYINLGLRKSFASAYNSAPHRAYNLQAGTYITWQCWLPYNPYGFGALYNDYNGIKKIDNEGAWGLANVIIGISRNTYQSDPGQQQILISRTAGDPEYSPLPGTILAMLNKSRLSKEAFRSLVAGYSLKPDGTIGPPSKLGDKIRGSDGKMYELVPRPGYGYNQWVPVKQASAGSDNQIAAEYGAGFPKTPAWMKEIDKIYQDTKNKPYSPGTPKPGNPPPPGYSGWNAKERSRNQYAFYEPQGELISEDRKKILPEKLQHIDFDEITDLEEFEKALSASQLIMLEKNLLKYIEENPEQIEALRKRYPILDPRLSELNYKLDKMVSASDEYLETQFPQNQELFNKVQKIIKKNIKLTDPKNFKTIKDPVTHVKLLSVGYVNQNEKPKKKLRLQNRNKETAARFLKKARIKTNQEVIDDKIKQLDLDMKKTMGDSKHKK